MSTIRDNQAALRAATQEEKDIALEDLDGFQLPPEVTEEFLTRMQKEAGILDMADTMTMDRLEMEVPSFGVPRLSGSARAEGGSRTSSSGAESGEVAFNVTDQNYYILVEPNYDALKNTHQGSGLGNHIISQFVERFGNDVALIGMRANANNGNLSSYASEGNLDTTYDGWIAIAEGADSTSDRIALEDTASGEVNTMTTLSNQEDDGSGTMVDSPLDTTSFHETIQTLDSRYRDPNDAVFLTSPSQVQQYHYDLTDRQDGLGVAVLQGDNDVTPFDYDVVGIPGWPDSYMMLTDPENLAYGLFHEMDVAQTRDSDEVYERRLHSRNWMEAQFDFQIKRLQAGVLVTGIQTPAMSA